MNKHRTTANVLYNLKGHYCESEGQDKLDQGNNTPFKIPT